MGDDYPLTTGRLMHERQVAGVKHGLQRRALSVAVNELAPVLGLRS